MPDNPQHSPLHDRHLAAAAKLADFGGWEMPLEYAGGGVLREHAAVRSTVGIFDVSHLGKLRVTGPGAKDFLNRCLSNDLDRIGSGSAQYTLCCEYAGGVVDDLIAYRVSEEDLLLVPNAANAAEVRARLQDAVPDGVRVEDLHLRLGVLAVQGPRSFDVLQALGLPSDDLDYMQHRVLDWQGSPVLVCRTGYTGERGVELLPLWEHAGGLWDALLDTVAAYDGRPCGLGARDTLRTEMGYPLHGQDLSRQITPVQARLGWAVGWKKDAFWGRQALVAEREAGPARMLWGLESTDRGIPRPGMPVLSAGGGGVGSVTSGTFSPTRRLGIGLALLDREVAEGELVRVDVRGRPSQMRVVKPPFVTASTR